MKSQTGFDQLYHEESVHVPATQPHNKRRAFAGAGRVVVIGGGVIGVSAAYHLAKKGHSVALIEKGHVGAEQSSRNWGWCRQQGRARAEIPLAREALRLWEDMQNDAGVDAGFRRTGASVLTKNPEELAAWEKWAEIAREQQVHSTVLSPAEVAERVPGNADSWVGGLHTPSDGRAEPSMAVPALAAAARKHGVTDSSGLRRAWT